MMYRNRTRFALLFATATGAALVGGAALADDHRGGRHMDMRAAITQFDLDGDGALTLAEIEEAQALRFSSADADGDGLLSEAELAEMLLRDMEARKANLATRAMKHMDDNDDGVLSPDEAAMPRIDRLFSHLDADDDGIVSAEELAEIEGRRGWWGNRG
jgi:Ca2+-binding EF-hand superfamily protein